MRADEEPSHGQLPEGRGAQKAAGWTVGHGSLSTHVTRVERLETPSITGAAIDIIITAMDHNSNDNIIV